MQPFRRVCSLILEIMEMGYGTASTASHSLSTSRLLSGSGRHRQDPPRAGVRARVLHAGPQDLLGEGQRAQGQVPEGDGARERPARGGDACKAVLSGRRRGREVRVRQGVHRPLLRRDRPSLRKGGSKHHDPHEQHGAKGSVEKVGVSPGEGAVPVPAERAGRR